MRSSLHGTLAATIMTIATIHSQIVLGDMSRKASKPISNTVISLNGEGWLLTTDPQNAGREEQWWSSPRADARPARIPGTIQDVFPGYHGIVWYWRDFTAPINPASEGRYLIRFWNADYQAEVWLNGTRIGSHEGAEGVFTLDATAAMKPEQKNWLAVRLLNPTDEPIDGILLKQTPHRNKTCQFTFGCDYNHGGLEDSVDLLVSPAVRITDLYVRPDPKTGSIEVRTAVRNALAQPANGRLEITVSPAVSGDTLARDSLSQSLPPGDTNIETQIRLNSPRLWQLSDPYLYRVTARLMSERPETCDEQAACCGFRDFRIEDGYFRLNGKRIFLRCSHTGNECPIGLHVSYDREWLRRDLLNVKAMGFNAIRFIAGLATPYQLELCDQIGLLVYEEPYCSWLLEDSPKMQERFNRSTSEMILRDRNHPSVAIWGLLNETGDGPVFRHAVTTLPLVRSLDDTRLVLLNSGRFDRQLGIGSVSNPGSMVWQFLLGAEYDGAAPSACKMMAPSCEGVGDFHIYPQVPHPAEAVRTLRTLGEGTKPVFISEYGIATAVNLSRLARHFEQRGQENCGSGIFYRQPLDLFMRDWKKWRMAETFGRPEDYFTACLAKNAGQRLMGINAIRANPNINGYSLTGTVDQGYSGEGLTTTFRELKPGTMDAIFDGFAPLRWCMFAEPMNLYRGAAVKLEAVLANEDVLHPGEYPARIEVFGPKSVKVFEQQITVKVPVSRDTKPIWAWPVFSEQVTADWPSGTYRFVAMLEKGGAAAGGQAEFHVADPADMPKVDATVLLWGEDPELAQWLSGHGIKVRPFAPHQSEREMILVGNKAAAPGGAEAFGDLARHIVRGSTAIFLSPQVFANGDQKTAWVPLAEKGTLAGLPSCIYHKDEWTKDHPFFHGLPIGLMDYGFYREIIPSLCWTGLDVPEEAVAGAIQAAPAYEAGLMLSVHKLGEGRLVLNSLLIRETLGRSPVAERLLRNMLRAGSPDMASPPGPSHPELIRQLGLK